MPKLLWWDVSHVHVCILTGHVPTLSCHPCIFWMRNQQRMRGKQWKMSSTINIVQNVSSCQKVKDWVDWFLSPRASAIMVFIFWGFPTRKNVSNSVGESCIWWVSSELLAYVWWIQMLGYRGILDMLGIRQTAGSVDVLPPSRSQLLKTFTALNK